MSLPRHLIVFRSSYTLAAILALGAVTGALLAETSLMTFELSSPLLFHPRLRGHGTVNDYLTPASNYLQTSRRAFRRPVLQGHHTGS